MLIDLKEVVKKYSLNIKGVIQVGAHWAEEHNELVSLGVERFLYIEPCRESYKKMLDKIGGNGMSDMSRPCSSNETIWDGLLTREKQSIIFGNVACGDIEGEMEMYVSPNNQGQSNSLLKPYLHLSQHPEVVFSEKELVRIMTLDNIVKYKGQYNLLMMDVQGAEGLVLKGATETLKHIDCIYTEVNRDYTYEGNMLIDEMDEYLYNFGFIRVETYWPSPLWSWGDAIYLKQIA
jgi:FkbM family methyltransferase